MIAVAQVLSILIPWVGPSLSDLLFPTAERICVRLSGYSSKRSPEDDRDFVRQHVFESVYRLTGGSLLVFPSPGQEVTMCPDDFDTIADEIMFLLFDTFPADTLHLRILQEYAERTGSLSALRKIYVSFGGMLSGGEMAALKRVILGFPAFRLYWLTDAGGFPS
ncbi:MAG: hypothetical protein IKI84_11515 [Clostridia bacterium]|nr:hypothetical protein [Clostridia bacterium]